MNSSPRPNSPDLSFNWPTHTDTCMTPYDVCCYVRCACVCAGSNVGAVQPNPPYGDMCKVNLRLLSLTGITERKKKLLWRSVRANFHSWTSDKTQMWCVKISFLFYVSVGFCLFALASPQTRWWSWSQFYNMANILFQSSQIVLKFIWSLHIVVLVRLEFSSSWMKCSLLLRNCPQFHFCSYIPLRKHLSGLQICKKKSLPHSPHPCLKEGTDSLRSLWIMI